MEALLEAVRSSLPAFQINHGKIVSFVFCFLLFAVIKLLFVKLAWHALFRKNITILTEKLRYFLITFPISLSSSLEAFYKYSCYW